MQRLPRANELVREGVNGNGIHQIKRLNNHAWHGCQRAVCFGEIPGRDDDFCTCGKKRSSGLKANTRIASGDDGNLLG
jgi:hypothetical protein